MSKFLPHSLLFRIICFQCQVQRFTTHLILDFNKNSLTIVWKQNFQHPVGAIDLDTDCFFSDQAPYMEVRLLVFDGGFQGHQKTISLLCNGW